MMQGDETSRGERRETVGELSELLNVVQRMGRRLAYETHGESYDPVRKLNEHLHQAREQIELIRQASIKLR
jgi:recombinational DNA repair protein RecR